MIWKVYLIQHCSFRPESQPGNETETDATG